MAELSELDVIVRLYTVEEMERIVEMALPIKGITQTIWERKTVWKYFRSLGQALQYAQERSRWQTRHNGTLEEKDGVLVGSSTFHDWPHEIRFSYSTPFVMVQWEMLPGNLDAMLAEPEQKIEYTTDDRDRSMQYLLQDMHLRRLARR